MDKISAVQKCLDSDDEFPDSYDEEPEIPAYLDDTRFNKIQFKWLTKDKIKTCRQKHEDPQEHLLFSESKQEQTLGKGEIEKHLSEHEAPPDCLRLQLFPENNPQKTEPKLTIQRQKEKILIKKGILSEKDILCLKSFAAVTTDDLLLTWFFDFLVGKDLQSDNKYLKSCLVPRQGIHKISHKQYSHESPKTFNNVFEFIVS